MYSPGFLRLRWVWRSSQLSGTQESLLVVSEMRHSLLVRFRTNDELGGCAATCGEPDKEGVTRA